MSRLKVRVAGAWVDSDKSGAVRYNNTTVPYGPPGGLSYETIDWISPPALTVGDDSTTYSMGVQFSVVASKTCSGLQWRVPDAPLPAPTGGVYYALLFSISPAIQLVKKTFTPVAGDFQDILFDTPVSVSAGTDYIAAVLTRKYSFRAASSVGGFPLTSPSGNIVGAVGKLSETSDPDTVPGGSFQSIYYISPIISV